MRTTDAKPTLELQTHGPDALTGVLATALGHPGREDRWTHGFHTYPAGLHPDAARDLIAAFDAPRVLDPFCGGGTTLVEALAAGRQAVGRDISAVALLVATARTTVADDAALTSLRATARALAAAARGAGELPPPRLHDAVADWYAPHVLVELEALRRGIAEADVSRQVRLLLKAAWSSILIKTSFRASDTSARRLVHDRPPGTTAVLFHKRVRELGRQLVDLRDAVPPGTPVPDIDRCDARALTLDAPVDLVVTSPPYPSVYDYVPMQALREAWLDTWSPTAAEIGPRRAWRAAGDAEARRIWEDDTRAWMAAVARVVRPGGHVVIVIGDGLTPWGPVPTRAPTIDAGGAAGLTLRAWASSARPDHARDDVRWEHALVFARQADIVP